MTPSRTRVLAPLVAVVVVAALASLLLFAPLARRILLDPIVGAIGVIRRALAYVPQGLQWLVALSVAFIAAGAYVARRLPRREKPSAASVQRAFPSEGPTLRVARILRLSSRYRHRRIQLVVELRDLAARVLAQHRGIPVLRAKSLLDTEDWTDDEAVRDYLSSDEHRHRLVRRRDVSVDVERVLDQIEKIHQEA